MIISQTTSHKKKNDEETLMVWEELNFEPETAGDYDFAMRLSEEISKFENFLKTKSEFD